MMKTKMFGRLLVMFALPLMILIACAPVVTATPTIPAPTETFIPTQAPTEAPASTATTGVAYLKFPSVNCCRGSLLSAGVYEIPSWFGIPLTVEIPEGWRVLNEEAALLFLIGRGRNVQNNPSQMIVFLNVTGEATQEGLIESVQRAPELTVMAEPVTVTLAGFPGLQLDSAAKPNPSYEGDSKADIPPGVQFLPVFMKYFTPGFSWTTFSPEARVRTIVLTVHNQTLLLYLESPQEEFDAFMDDAGQLLGSLKLPGN